MTVFCGGERVRLNARAESVYSMQDELRSKDTATLLCMLAEQRGTRKPRRRKRVLAKAIATILSERKHIAMQEAWPRNVQLYGAVRSRLGDSFGWTLGENGARPVVRFHGYPRMGVAGRNRCAVHPTLAELLHVELGALTTLTPREHDALRPLVEVGEVGREFATMLRRLPISLPPQEVTEAVARWLTLALKGEASTVFSPVCPDYAVDGDGRYTFQSLGSGVGLVARRVQAALPAFAVFCAKHHLPITFVVGMGDSEAENPANCTRVRLTKEQFVDCLRGSQEAFRASTDPTIPLQVPLMTEVGKWDEAMGMARAEAALGRYTGALPLTNTDWEAICAARTSLYERWYGAGVDVASILKAQAPEYLAMGMLARRAYPNCLILGGDAPAMAPFFQGMATRVEPVVYLKKVDY